MERNRKETAPIEPTQRAQTLQDFAIGIGVFLLAVAFAFSTLPTSDGRWSTSDGSVEERQSERIADMVISEFGSGQQPNELNGTAIRNASDLETHFGLHATANGSIESISISVETLDRDEEIIRRGHEYDRERSATTERIVTLEDSSLCSTACRLVVRCW